MFIWLSQNAKDDRMYFEIYNMPNSNFQVDSVGSVCRWPWCFKFPLPRHYGKLLLWYKCRLHTFCVPDSQHWIFSQFFRCLFFCICLITICLNHTEVDCKGVLKQDIEIKLGRLRSPGTLQWSHVTEPGSHGYCCMLCFKSFYRSSKKSKIYVLGSIRRPSSVKCGN